MFLSIVSKTIVGMGAGRAPHTVLTQVERRAGGSEEGARSAETSWTEAAGGHAIKLSRPFSVCRVRHRLQARKKSRKINDWTPETIWWGGGLPREGAEVKKVVPSLVNQGEQPFLARIEVEICQTESIAAGRGFTNFSFLWIRPFSWETKGNSFWSWGQGLFKAFFSLWSKLHFVAPKSASQLRADALQNDLVEPYCLFRCARIAVLWSLCLQRLTTTKPSETLAPSNYFICTLPLGGNCYTLSFWFGEKMSVIVTGNIAVHNFWGERISLM